MFCGNCGQKIEEGSKFCASCGKAVSKQVEIVTEDLPENLEDNTEHLNSVAKAIPPRDQYADASQDDDGIPSGHSVSMAFMLIASAFVVAIILVAVYVDSPSISTVKKGYFSDYPYKTVGETFKDFFGNPKWKEATSAGYKVVEFTGDAFYQGEAATVCIEFSVDDGNFDISHMTVWLSNGDMHSLTKEEIASELETICG